MSRRGGRALAEKEFTCRFCGVTRNGGKFAAKAKRVHEALCDKRPAPGKRAAS